MVVTRTAADRLRRISRPSSIPFTGWIDVASEGTSNVEVTFLNGWENFTRTRPVRFRLSSGGRVDVVGRALGGWAGHPIFRLPPGYRPGSIVHRRTPLINGGESIYARVAVYPSGIVRVEDPGGDSGIAGLQGAGYFGRNTGSYWDGVEHFVELSFSFLAAGHSSGELVSPGNDVLMYGPDGNVNANNPVVWSGFPNTLNPVQGIWWFSPDSVGAYPTRGVNGDEYTYGFINSVHAWSHLAVVGSLPGHPSAAGRNAPARIIDVRDSAGAAYGEVTRNLWIGKVAGDGYEGAEQALYGGDYVGYDEVEVLDSSPDKLTVRCDRSIVDVAYGFVQAFMFHGFADDPVLDVVSVQDLSPPTPIAKSQVVVVTEENCLILSVHHIYAATAIFPVLNSNGKVWRVGTYLMPITGYVGGTGNANRSLLVWEYHRPGTYTVSFNSTLSGPYEWHLVVLKAKNDAYLVANDLSFQP